MTCFVYRIQVPCPECGQAVLLDGPVQSATCLACATTITLPGWKNILGFRAFVGEFKLKPGQTRGSSLTDGELRILIKWGPGEPTCAACHASLNGGTVATGSEGLITCGTCARETPTYPAPDWLRRDCPSAAQVFGAWPEGVAPPVAAASTRPILFQCAGCGAGLKLTADAARIVTCSHCDADQYLPDDLWRALHPVRVRTPFWIRFDA